MSLGRETTAREDTEVGTSPAKLALQWVWPACRIDRLQGAHVGIGRDAAATIRLQGSGVSRQHAELYRQGPLYALRDLGSTNGTWLDGRRIEHAPVEAGSVVRIGDFVGVFSLVHDASRAFAEVAPGLFGGPEMASVLEPLMRAAVTNLPLMLVGATGTGKERVARAAHTLSGRGGPFVAINCAALPEQLAEAELFGYRRGAFTGAERASVGHFRAAHGGTLFLDEMPELPAPLQAKLLRVVEDGQVLSLGESQPVGVDVRLISASQRPLAELVGERALREDLAARLGGLEVRLPGLAKRRADIAPLFAKFLEQQCGGRPPEVEARLVEALCLHDWPQNVRELELLTRRLLAVHGHEPRLRRQHLPGELAQLCESATMRRHSAPPRDRREHDLENVRQELERNGGNIKAAAETLGISRQRIYRILGTTDSPVAAAGSEHDVRG